MAVHIPVPSYFNRVITIQSVLYKEIHQYYVKFGFEYAPLSVYKNCLKSMMVAYERSSIEYY